MLAPAKGSGARIVELAVSKDGVVDTGSIARHLPDKGVRTLVALQLANNETGAVQPVADAVRLARERGVAVHTDAVQAAGRITIDFRALGVDYLTLSAHKLGGPKGVGALVIRDGASLPALISGGGQERRRRAGTENVAAIAGFGAAAQAVREDLAQMDRVRALRDRLEAQVREITPEAVVVAADAERLPNTTSLALARQQRRDARHRPRPQGHRGQRRRRLLVGQGRRQPRAGGDGAWPRGCPLRHPHQPGPRQHGARCGRIPRCLGPHRRGTARARGRVTQETK